MHRTTLENSEDTEMMIEPSDHMNTWTMSRSSPRGPSDSNLSSEIQTPNGTFLIIKDLSTSALKMTKASVLPPSKSCHNEGEKNLNLRPASLYVYAMPSPSILWS